MSEIYEKLEVSYSYLDNKRQMPIKMTLKQFYHEDESGETAPLFHGDAVLEVLLNENNQKMLSELEKLTIEFRRIVTLANNPINYLCCRGNFFGLKFVNLFHSND